MADKRQRDRAIERMLRRVAAPPASAASDACVDGETLAAWSSGSLAREDAARVDDHLADCARCQSMLAAFSRTEPVAAAPVPWWQRADLRWLVPLATAATVAAIWVAIPQRTATPGASQPANSPAAQTFKAEPFVRPSQPAPGASAESAPGAAQSPATVGGQQSAAERREARAPEQKQSPRPLQERADEADARAGAGNRAAGERAVAAPPATAAPAAPQPAAATPVAGESAARDAVTPRMMARTAAAEVVSPGGATRWRIIDGQLQRSTTQGQTWDAVDLPSATITAGHSPAATVAWFVGRAGAIFVTTDGSRFERAPFVSSADLVSVVAVDGQRATVTTVDGRQFRTADRGVTWIQQ